MSAGAPPLRFLALILGGWVCVRVLVLLPSQAEADAVAKPLTPRTSPSASLSPPPNTQELALPPETYANGDAYPKSLPKAVRAASIVAGLSEVGLEKPAFILPAATAPIPAATQPPFSVPGFQAVGAASLPGRWSFSAWSSFRRGDARQLAAGGTLGGSQVGARLSYALGNRLALTGRAYAPVRSKGAEAAIGLEWQPSSRVPLKLLAERRQALDDRGRSAFAVMAYGGVSEVELGGSVRLDAYAQAGVVGLRSRDAFVDGAVRVGVPITPAISIGAGFWAAAQPGVERLDAGPQVSFRLPVEGATFRISAEWRQRIVGDAAPGSGPALTLSTDF